MTSESMNEIIRGRAAGRRLLPASETAEAKKAQREAEREAGEMLGKLRESDSAEEPADQSHGSADGGAGTANRQRREPGLAPRSMNERLREAAGR